MGNIRRSFILGFCVCGCEKEISIINYYKNFLKTFEHGHNRRGVKYKSKRKNTGKPRENWAGYITIKKYDYKNNKSRYQRFHRLVYEEYHKCCLLPYTVIHHIDGNRKNNKIENLKPLFKNIHNKLTSDLRIERLNIDNRTCLSCHSNNTRIDKRNNTKMWFKFNNGFICRKCYDKRRYHRKCIKI